MDEEKEERKLGKKMHFAKKEGNEKVLNTHTQKTRYKLKDRICFFYVDVLFFCEFTTRFI